MSRSPAPEHILNLQTRIILGKEKKEPTDDTRKDVYLLLAQHVSGIIMPIIRRQKPDAALFSLSPDDGHIDARNILS